MKEIKGKEKERKERNTNEKQHLHQQFIQQLVPRTNTNIHITSRNLPQNDRITDLFVFDEYFSDFN